MCGYGLISVSMSSHGHDIRVEMVIARHEKLLADVPIESNYCNLLRALMKIFFL